MALSNVLASEQVLGLLTKSVLESSPRIALATEFLNLFNDSSGRTSKWSFWTRFSNLGVLDCASARSPERE